MSSLDADLIALIDQRVRAAQAVTAAQGTCVDRDTTGPKAQVLFDGSTVAMPVLVLGHVNLQPGMRCVLNRYERTWVVTGSFAHPEALGAATIIQFGPADTVTSATFVDLAINAWTFTKLYDLTQVRLGMSAAAFSTAVNTIGRWALRLTPQDPGNTYTPVDLQLSHVAWNAANEHKGGYAEKWVADIPAGAYTCQIRWKRNSGTGTITTNVDNLYTVTMVETPAPGVPIT